MGEVSSNGFLLAVLNYAIQEYGWHVSYALDESLIMIMLLMRQKVALSSKGGISLFDQEKLDTIGKNGLSWEEMVAENRRNLAKQMGYK